MGLILRQRMKMSLLFYMSSPSVEAVKFLLDNSVDVNAKVIYNITALM